MTPPKTAIDRPAAYPHAAATRPREVPRIQSAIPDNIRHTAALGTIRGRSAPAFVSLSISQNEPSSDPRPMKKVEPAARRAGHAAEVRGSGFANRLLNFRRKVYT